MTAALFVPLLMPFAAPALARWAVPHVRPVFALWALTVTACALASCWLAALGGLVLAGALAVSALSHLGHLIHPLDVAPAVQDGVVEAEDQVQDAFADVHPGVVPSGPGWS
ncbi:hypothetical protein ABZ054_13125, partial [Streptomyces sp. NPDC006324]